MSKYSHLGQADIQKLEMIGYNILSSAHPLFGKRESSFQARSSFSAQARTSSHVKRGLERYCCHLEYHKFLKATNPCELFETSAALELPSNECCKGAKIFKLRFYAHESYINK